MGFKKFFKSDNIVVLPPHTGGKTRFAELVKKSQEGTLTEEEREEYGKFWMDRLDKEK